MKYELAGHVLLTTTGLFWYWGLATWNGQLSYGSLSKGCHNMSRLLAGVMEPSHFRVEQRKLMLEAASKAVQARLDAGDAEASSEVSMQRCSRLSHDLPELTCGPLHDHRYTEMQAEAIATCIAAIMLASASQACHSVPCEYGCPMHSGNLHASCCCNAACAWPATSFQLWGCRACASQSAGTIPRKPRMPLAMSTMKVEQHAWL